MNRFSRIRHHVSMEDVKQRHLENLNVKKELNEEVEKEKYNWRKQLQDK